MTRILLEYYPNGPPSQHQSSLLSIFLSFCAMLGFIDGVQKQRGFGTIYPSTGHYKRLQELGCKTEQLRVSTECSHRLAQV
jgi:hypothetical protein